MAQRERLTKRGFDREVDRDDYILVALRFKSAGRLEQIAGWARRAQRL